MYAPLDLRLGMATFALRGRLNGDQLSRPKTGYLLDQIPKPRIEKEVSFDDQLSVPQTVGPKTEVDAAPETLNLFHQPCSAPGLETPPRSCRSLGEQLREDAKRSLRIAIH